METLKRKIDDDAVILNRLNSSAQAQNAVTTLQDQVEKEIESLDEVVREESVFLEKHQFQQPEISSNDADQIPRVLDELRKKVKERLDQANASHKQTIGKVSIAQSLLSEKSTLFSASQKTIASLRTQLQDLSSVSNDWQSLLEKVQNHDVDVTKHGFDGDDIESLIQYLEERLARVQNDIVDVMDSETAERHVKKLTKWIKKQMVVDNAKRCPCCQQEANEGALGAFLELFYAAGQKILHVPSDELNAAQNMKSFYNNALKKAGELKGGLRDIERIKAEVSDVEKDAKRLQSEVSQCNEDLKSLETERDVEDAALGDIQSLSETVRRWVDDASRIAEKRAEIHQKKLDLSAEAGSVDGRDLRTVDREILEMREEKDNLAAKINRLNKETTEINRRVTEMSSRVRSM